jgi:hypothetical protein
MNPIIEYNKMIRWLIIITAGIIFINITSELIGNPSWQIQRLFDVGRDSNIPTWFSSILLAIAAYFAYKCSTLTKVGKKTWAFLSLGLLVMSCDEVAMMHENFGEIVNKYIFKLDGFHQTVWPIVLGPFILFIMLIFVIKLRKHLQGSRKAIKWLSVGLVTYIVGAFFLEVSINWLNHGSLEWLWIIEYILEESCEMFGIIFIIQGLIKHIDYLEESAII